MMHLTRVAAVLLGVGCLVLPAPAEESPLLAELRRAQKQALSRPSADELDARQRHCAAALENANTYLDAAGVGESWRAHLAWDACRAAVEQPTLESLAPLRTTWRRLSGTTDGLDLPPLLRLRSALGALLRARRLMLQSEQLAAARQSRLTELQEQLLSEAPDAGQVQGSLQWLVANEQAPQLVALLRSEWSRPNLFVDIPRSTLGTLTETPVSEVRPISEQSDGVPIRGTAIVTGMVRLVPQADGELHAVFQGHVDTTMSGAKGPASFRLKGDTALTASKRIHLGKDQFFVWPASASACSSLRTDCVNSKFKRVLGRVVRRVAAKEIDKQRPAATRDLSKQTADSFVEDFDKDLVAELADARRDFNEDLLAPLLKLDADPRRMEFVSTEQQLQLVMQVETPIGLAASSSPPPVSTPHTLAIRMHETMANRLAEQALRGDTVSISELAEKLEPSEEAEKDGAAGATSGGTKPDGEAKGEPAAEEEEQVNLRIEFTEEDPLQVQFEGDELIVRLQGRNFYYGNWVGSAMNVEVRYGVEYSNGQYALVRHPKIDITPPPQGRSLRFFSQRSVLRRRLAEELPEREEIEPFTLPSPADDLGPLRVTGLTMEGGWLTTLLDK